MTGPVFFYMGVLRVEGDLREIRRRLAGEENENAPRGCGADTLGKLDEAIAVVAGLTSILDRALMHLSLGGG